MDKTPGAGAMIAFGLPYRHYDFRRGILQEYAPYPSRTPWAEAPVR